MKSDLPVCGLKDRNIFAKYTSGRLCSTGNENSHRSKKWLDVYFSGEEPNFTPPLHPNGSTFRKAVWQILLEIPYGQTITYGEIARRIAVMKTLPICPPLGSRRCGLDIMKFPLSFPVIES